MANLWVLLAVCWCFQHSTAFTTNSLDPSTQSASDTPLPSVLLTSRDRSLVGSIPTGNSAESSTEKSSTLSTKEILLSGTYDREAPSPTVSPLLGSNETSTHLPSSTLTSFNETRTALHPHRPTNTQPCNLHVEFCGRSYGNITYVGAHNSPFTRENNAAANQHLDTTTQLNDGIRMRVYYPLETSDWFSNVSLLLFSSRPDSHDKRDVVFLSYQVSNASIVLLLGDTKCFCILFEVAMSSTLGRWKTGSRAW